MLVDIAVDQGGCAETRTPTTHAIRCSWSTASHLLRRKHARRRPEHLDLGADEPTLPYIQAIADEAREAAARDAALAPASTSSPDRIVYEAVAEAHGFDYEPLDACPLPRLGFGRRSASASRAGESRTTEPGDARREGDHSSDVGDEAEQSEDGVASSTLE